MSKLIRFCFTVLVAVFCAALPLWAVTYVPVVEWNGTHFHVMNSSGIYDLQPVNDPVNDVAFSNSNDVAVWTDGTNYYAYIVDAYHERVQFFTTNITRKKEVTADFTWTDGAADEATEYDDNAIYLNNTEGDVVAGSELVKIDGVAFTRVSSLTGYDAEDYVYTIVYVDGDEDVSGVLTFVTDQLEDDSEIEITYAVSSSFDANLDGDLDYTEAAAVVNGTVVDDPFGIDETIPSNGDHPSNLENITAIGHIANMDAGDDVRDIYLLDGNQIHSFMVENDAAAVFEFVDTYDGGLSSPLDVTIAQSGENELAVVSVTQTDLTADFDDITAEVTNNCLITNHTYRVVCTTAGGGAGDVDEAVVSVVDMTTGSTMGQYIFDGAGPAYTMTTIPGMTLTWDLDAGVTNLQEDDYVTVTNTTATAVPYATQSILAATDFTSVVVTVTDNRLITNHAYKITATTAGAGAGSADGAVVSVLDMTTNSTVGTYTFTGAGPYTMTTIPGMSIVWTADGAATDLTVDDYVIVSMHNMSETFTNTGGGVAATAVTAVVVDKSLYTGSEYTLVVTTDQTLAGEDATGLVMDLYENPDLTTPVTVGAVTIAADNGGSEIWTGVIPGVYIISEWGALTQYLEDDTLAIALTSYDGAVGEAVINDYIFVADTGNDRIKIIKAGENNFEETTVGSGDGNYTNGATATELFADDVFRRDWFGNVTASVPNITYVLASKATENSLSLYEKTSLAATDSTLWMRVDNFANSNAADTHYMFNEETGVISFGDDARGMQPDVGDDFVAIYKPTLDVLAYGTSGGSTGQFNLPAGISSRWNASHGWFDVYVADTGNDRICKLKFVPATADDDDYIEWVTSWTTAGAGTALDGPTDIVVMSDGGTAAADTVAVFVCDTDNDRVVYYRDTAAENEGTGGATAPTFRGVLGSNGLDLGEYSHPTGIDVVLNGTSFEIYVSDSERNYVTKYVTGEADDEPALNNEYDISSVGYLPTGSYTYTKETTATYMASNAPSGAYIQYFFSDTTTAGQATPILCSSSHYAVTDTSFLWTFSATPSGQPADNVYYLYVRLYDADGNLLVEDKSSDLLEISSTLLTEGLGAYDDYDGDSYLYVQNGSIAEVRLVAVYPDSIATVNYTGTFPPAYAQITDISVGTGWEAVNHTEIIFQPSWDNTAGTFEVNTAMLGSNEGLANASEFVLAVISLQINSAAVTTTSRFVSSEIAITSSSWNDYNGTALATPSTKDLTLKIGYLGDIANTTGTYGTVPNMIPSPDGVFGINDIVAFSMAWNGVNGGIQDMLADLAPYSGTVPSVFTLPDGNLEIQDLMIFTTMFDWYNAQTFTVSLPGNEPGVNPGQGNIASAGNTTDNVSVVSRKEGVKTIVEVYADNVENLMSAELTVLYNNQTYRMENCTEGGFFDANSNIFFKGYERDNGYQVYLSSMNPSQPGFSGSGKLAEIELMNLADNDANISVGFDLRDTKGNVIDAGSTVIGMSALPGEFMLDAAYPNPFNSMTSLTYGLPEASNVRLSVYDISGRRVATLFNGEIQAGYHTAVWNAENASAGLYLVRMEAAGFTKTQKVMLVK